MSLRIDPHNTEGSSVQQIACPTCGALQAPADTCRRCKSDLRMVCDVRAQCEDAYTRTLALLRNRRLKRATSSAIQRRELTNDGESARLLAAAYLLQGDFSQALRVFRDWATRPHVQQPDHSSSPSLSEL